jgi:hypothetical protein
VVSVDDGFRFIFSPSFSPKTETLSTFSKKLIWTVVAQTIAITRRSYRLKDHAAIAGKEDKNKKTKSKPNEPSTAGAAS